MVERKRPSFIVASLTVAVLSPIFTLLTPATPALALTPTECWEKYGSSKTINQTTTGKSELEDFNSCDDGDICSIKPEGSSVYTITCRDPSAATDPSADPGGETDPSADPGGETGDAKSSCTIEGVGWIVCPVTNFLANIADGAKGILDGFLEVPAKKIFDTNEATYKYWSVMRNIANILFVLAFLIIILSQVTSIGISNYGIKKLLPKLLIIAVLVNVSFYICALAVDLSNFIGYSLAQFLSVDIINGADVTIDKGGVFSGNNMFANIAGILLAGGVGLATGVISIQFLLAAFIGAVISIVISGIVIIFLLAVRQGLIILLVVLSPVAFATMLLPNTENLHKKWVSLIKGMLLIFPIVSLLYGAGVLAREVLMGTSDNLLVKIIASTLPFVMLFLSIKVYKKSMEAIEGLASLTKGMESKKGSMLDNSVYGQYKNYRKREDDMRNAQIMGGAYTGRFGKLNPRNIRSALYRKANDSKLSGNFGNKLAATGAAVADKQDDEYLHNAGSRIDSFRYQDANGNETSLSQAQMMQLATGKDVTMKDASGKDVKIIDSSTVDTHMKRAAIQRAAKIATVADAEQLAQATSAVGSDGKLAMSAGERKTTSDALAQSGAIAKSPYLSGKSLGEMAAGTFDLRAATLRTAAEGKIKAETLASLDDTSSKTILSAITSRASSAQEQVLINTARQRLKAAADEVYKPGSRLTEKITGGSVLDMNLRSFR